MKLRLDDPAWPFNRYSAYRRARIPEAPGHFTAVYPYFATKRAALRWAYRCVPDSRTTHVTVWRRHRRDGSEVVFTWREQL